jgi:hypothetical protein
MLGTFLALFHPLYYQCVSRELLALSARFGVMTIVDNFF